MSKIKNFLSLKLLSMLLTFSILIGMVPPAFISAFAADDSFGTIETLVSGGSVDSSTGVVTFSTGCELNWSPANTAIGRWTDGWWVGIKVTAPENVDLEKASYQNESSNGWGDAKSFKSYRDSNDESATQYITLWGVVNEGYINDAIINNKEYLEYSYQFDWDGDGTYEQPISMRVDPKNIVLNRDGAKVYPKATGLAEVDVITSGLSATNNGSNVVVVENTSTVELTWVAADTSIGRNNDGWWIGYNVVAPDGWNVEKASYQYKTSTGWDTANTYSFNNTKDTNNSIQVWRLVNEAYLNNAIANNKDVNYITRYDWDGDGVYEQIVHLKIVPSKVLLKAENGEQVYPYLGTVTPLTGGTVVGNTSNLELKIEETTLNWSPKDESIGRNTDGWWVGMKVTAPEGYTAEQLKDATYKRRVTSSGGTAWSAYSSDISFWSLKDSKDSDSVHHIGMWMVVNPSLIATYKNNGTNIKTEYVFDWDGNGTDDQTITLIVVPSDNIVLNKVAQTGFDFVEPNPVDKWVGESYTNTATGGQGTGKVTYAITSGSDIADVDAETGKLTFKKTGTVQVTATKAADDTYAEVTATYTVKSIKYPQVNFKFENSNVDIYVEFKDGSFTNTASGGSGDGEITYSISDDKIATIDSNTGTVTFIKAGQVTVIAKKAADDKYTETTATYTLTIGKSEQDALSFASAPTSITYKTDAQDVITVTGGNGDGKVTYSITDGNGVYATIDKDTGAITTLKAGGSFTVQIEKAGDDGYNAAAPITATIYVDYAEQNNFTFDDADPDNITFNDGNNVYSNVANGGESEGAISYSFADAESDAIADIDAATGEVTINAAGTINVVATKAGDDCYKEATATYSLTVEKDMPEFTVSDVNLIYGVEEYQINVETALGGEGNYVYSIEGANDIGASVDNNGKVTFTDSIGKVGSINIKVKKESDNQYKELEKSFTLTVSYHEPTAQPTVDGATKNESGWYTGVVTVKAPEGYLISYSNELSNTTWADSVTVNTDGDNSKEVYLKKGNEISGAISFDSIKIDTVVPGDVDIRYDTPVLEKVLGSVTFGIYEADTVAVTLTATDTTSGIDYFTYNTGNGDIIVKKDDFTKNENGVAEYTFLISAQYRDKVTMTATDIAGWTSELTETKHTLVVDTISPVLDVKYDFAGSKTLSDIIYSNNDVTVMFEISEDNFDIRANDPVLIVGSMTVALTWSYDEDAKVWKAEQLLSGDNTYNLSLTFTDASGNEMTKYEQTIIIDSVKPVIASSYDMVVPVKENIYNNDRTATFTITESNFNAENVVLTVTARDITGADVDISSKAYTEYVKNPANWTQNGNVYTIKLPTFDIDAIYTVDIAYTDLADNTAEDYEADEFVLDKTVPTGIEIEYSESLWDKVIEAVTFGFYKGNVEVTVTAEDNTAGVEYFEITYTQVDGANKSNKATYTTDKLTAVQDENNKNVFTATHTITADARGKVSVNVVDKAGNTNGRNDDYVVVADTIAPGLSYKYTFTDNQVREYNEIYYTQGETKVEFTIEEANFDISNKPILTVNGVAQDINWTQVAETDKWVTDITLTGDGDYVIELTYADHSTNAMETYRKEVHIDSVAPKFDVSYDNNDAKNENNYKANRTATVKVTEHNFKAEEVVLTVTAKDITGADVDISSKAYAEYAKNPANWTQDGDVWTLNIDNTVFNIDAIYSVKLEYTDLAENEASPYITEFVIDKTAPSNVKIEYSESLWDKVIEAVTFGFYKGNVEVTVTAEDNTAGVEYFEITYTQVDGANKSNKATYTTDKLTAVQDETDKKVFTATHTIESEARGKVSVDVTDKAGNTTGKEDDYVVVADTIAPGLDYEWTFTNGQVREYNEIYYTQGESKVEFTIEEANFDISNKPILTVNGVAQDKDWTQVGETDKWVTDITLTGDGDYVIELTYADHSTNAMETYRKEVHIDSVAPKFDVSYDNNDAKNENNYKADRTATVKVTEHNFKADEVVLTVTAKDITGADVDISSKAYAEYAKNPANWTQNGDVWTLVLPTFDIDAIYSVKLEYTDLAENEATPYTTEFVIDKTAPSNVKIEYSESIVNKIIGTITFGFYKPDVTVTLTADDITSGVDYFEWTYTKEEGASDKNTDSYGAKITTEDIVYSNDGLTATATFKIPAQARGYISTTVTDRAGNATSKTDENNINVVVDDITPELECKYTFTDNQVREYNEIYYTQGETKVEFTIEEANFDLSLKKAEDEAVAPAPVLTVNGVAQDINWTQVAETDKWVTDITLTGDGDYVIGLTYADRSTNAMETYRKEVHIDSVAPKFDVSYDNNDAKNENNYKADRTATVKVTEHNFKAEEVVLTVTAKDITGADVDISSKAYAEYAKNPANWTQDGDVWTLVPPTFDIDGIYSVKLEYTDLAENEATPYTADFVIDKQPPTNINIEYSSHINFWDEVLSAVTFGYYSYKDEMTVTLTADDNISGVDYFTWSYIQEENTSSINKTDDVKVISKENITYSNNGKTATATFVIDAQARGYISVDVTDKADNTSGEEDSNRINVVDNINPTRVIEFSEAIVYDRATMTKVNTYAEGDDVILYYENEAEVTITVNEANFYSEDVVVALTKNGQDSTPSVAWTDESADKHIGKFTISGDGDYFVKVSYTDRSGNVMGDYKSQEIRIDNTDPVTSVEYLSEAEAVNVKYYKADRKAIITIVDHNFLADDVVAEVTAVDVQGNKIANADAICDEFATYLKTRSSWTHNGDVHTAEITFSEDAQYTFKIDYKDIIGNVAETYLADPFVVDHVAPTNVNIEYSESIVNKIIGAITFGFYKPDVTVTLTADDITSGVDYFDWTYTKEEGTSDKNTDSYGERITTDDIVYSNNGLTATATFKIPANARGYISATATDRAGNADSKVDDNIINVVDNIAPTITIEYEADDADTKVQFVDNKQVTVDTFDKASNAYYNGNVTAKIVIDEANFFEGIEAEDGVIHNVGIKLTKTDDNGNKTVYEYLPVGAVQMYEGATPEYITWNTSGDEHSFNINYTDNADYVLEVEYTDISTNDADISANDGIAATKSYVSKVVTVDKIAPVVSVKYGNEKPIHTIENRDYFDAEQTATITVKEHNFRADDFVATVIAKDILDKNVKVENFKATLSDDSKWTQNGNTYTITIKYSVDANYSFDYEYKDLAQNAAAEYNEDLFTVDTTAPEKLTVSYSTSVLDKVLESVTFGYYNAEMTVTITAEDDTAGIYYFVYSYIKSDGVSDVNAELINDKIKDANNRIVHDGKKSTTSFTIPKLVLKNDNQFNGTVKFTAYDRSENNTEKVDNRRVVVDNITPTAKISYNNPVQKANGISYYDGNIDAKIVINEANFYSEDVVVKVTRDGANYPVKVKWVDNNVDVHTGTFTLTKDGDYIVTVEYTDRSANAMTKYTSNRLTLDTKVPTVNATNIKINSANKDEKYGFTITANDINLDASTFKPVLTATIRNDDGSYGTKTVSLGTMKTIESGKTYSFTVDDLKDDAIYSLVCTVKDMSGNEYSKIMLGDGKDYNDVRFSINRNGSTFAVEKDTDKLVDQYYVYSVDKDVVIEEVNVDPVENYVVKLNGKDLKEGIDYVSNISNKSGEWSKRTYIISKKLFESEGEYNIVVESTDKAETTAYSDVKNLNVSFVVDQTAPVLTISGLEEGARYYIDEQTVTIIPTDDGGRLYSIKVIVVDSKGNPLKDANGKDISVRFEMSGEEFLTYLTENDGKITFKIPELVEGRVQIICNDCAVNTDGDLNEYNVTFKKVTVSQDWWVIFYATKPLFYGSIAGVVLLVGTIIFLILYKKRKKEEEK